MAAVVSNLSRPAITKPKPKLPRQTSVIRAFTTEDCDVGVFTESAGCESPEVKDASVTLREKTPEEKAAAEKRKTKRRSKSVGAPDFQIRLLPAYLNAIGQSSKTLDNNESQVGARKSSKTKAEKPTFKKDPLECEKMLNVMKGLGFPGGPEVSPCNTMYTKPSSGKRGVQTLPGTGKQSVMKSLPEHAEQNIHGQMGPGKQSIDGLSRHSQQSVPGLPGADNQGDNGLPGIGKQSVDSLPDHGEQNVPGQTGPGEHCVVGLPLQQGQGQPGTVKVHHQQIVDGVPGSGKQDVHGLPGHGKEIDDHQETSCKDDADKEFNKSVTENTKKPIITIEIPQEGGKLADSGISEEKSPTSTTFKKKGLAPPNRCAVGSKKLTRRLSRKLTGRMTQRQRQELMLEGEFDEFDIGVEEAEETKDSNSIKSPPESDDEGNISDDTDHEFETEIVTRLNMGRIEADDDGGSGDESSVVEMTKTHRIANELLTTERSYVKKLHLLDQIFHLEVVRTNREHQMFPENVVPRMFSNIKSIYQFHNDFLLPQLEKRMAEWHAEPRFGDVMKKFAPFLKLYSEYVKNFDCAMKMINFWSDRSPKFARLLMDIQMRPECGHLTLQHHMLEPIQRVPRYQLLLKDYLKHLDVHSVDRQDTEKALDLVAMAATHSNEAMRKIEKFRKLLDVNERLAGIDLINPTRELVKEGKIIRISARDGDHIERYLFLFNDLLLVCQSLPLSIGSKQQFKIKSKIDVEGLQVFEGHNLETPDTFYIQGQQKSIELHSSSVEEKMDWQNALETVIAEHNKTCSVRRASVILGNQVDREIIGKVPPVWIKDQETSMCMNCTTTFTTFRRRHHCRACGYVICGKCSSHKAPLVYNDNIVSRVCDPCFEILSPVDHGQSEAFQCQTSVRSHKQQPQQHQPQNKKLPVILQVKASDPCVLNGYLHISCNKKTWLRRWFSVRDNFVLYSFKAHQDVVALTSLPLPGYKVVPVDLADGIDRENTLKIYHNGDSSKVYFLQTEDKASFNRWIDILQRVVLLELPPAEKQPEVHSPTARTSIPDDLNSGKPPLTVD